MLPDFLFDFDGKLCVHSEFRLVRLKRCGGVLAICSNGLNIRRDNLKTAGLIKR